MTELQSILHACAAAEARRADALLATVVHVEGSTYRRPGARKLLTSDGQSLGLISGGCLESAVRRQAFWLTAQDRATVVRYDTSAGDDVALEFALGCQGVVDVLLERFSQAVLPPALASVRAALDRNECCVLATVVASDQTAPVVGDRCAFDAAGHVIGPALPPALSWISPALRREATDALAQRRSRLRAFGPLVVFLEFVAPPTHLLIVGTGLDAPAMVRAAGIVGWDVTVAEPRAGYIAPARFAGAQKLITCPPEQLHEHVHPRTVAVIMTHNASDDLRALQALLPARLDYLGVLGPRTRTDGLLAELRRAAIEPTADQLGRLYAPVGLDLGAESPEEIALAVVGEIAAVLRGHPAGFLRDRQGPIHRPPLSPSPPIPSPLTQGVSCPI